MVRNELQELIVHDLKAIWVRLSDLLYDHLPEGRAFFFFLKNLKEKHELYTTEKRIKKTLKIRFLIPPPHMTRFLNWR